MKSRTFAALAVLLVAAIVIRWQLGRPRPAEPPPIVKDEPPKPRPTPSPSPAPSPAPSPVVHGWREDPEIFAWPKPPPPKKGEVFAVDPTHFMLDRAFVEKALADHAAWTKSARIVPETVAGKTVGARLFGIRARTFFDQLGFRNGDSLESMNGVPITDPAAVLEAYTYMRKTTRLFVTLRRSGAELTMHYLVTP